MNCLKTLPAIFWSSRATSAILQSSKRPAFESLRRGYAATYEGDGKTTATILNSDETLGLMINSYSPHGFRFNNYLFVQGSLAIFPNTALSWAVSSIDEVNEESLSLFFLLEPKLDILVIGVGDKEHCTRERIVFFQKICKKYDVALEVLSTDAACATFNFLNAERRFVAAALIPPIKGYDSISEKQRRPAFNAFT